MCCSSSKVRVVVIVARVALSLLAFLHFAVNAAENEEAWSPIPDDLAKKRVKELRQYLDERGAECRGCAEKSDWIEKVRETWDYPKVIIQEEEGIAEDTERGYERKTELLNKLNSKGIKVMGTDKMDLDKLEELMKAMDGIKTPGGEDVNGNDMEVHANDEL